MPIYSPYITTVDAAKLKLFNLASIIFRTRDFNKVEEEIAQASKIRYGILALELYPNDIDISTSQKIYLTLNHIAGVYNQQTIPNITA